MKWRGLYKSKDLGARLIKVKNILTGENFVVMRDRVNDLTCSDTTINNLLHAFLSRCARLMFDFISDDFALCSFYYQCSPFLENNQFLQNSFL